jgi:Protein of unknown function (DUF3617)
MKRQALAAALLTLAGCGAQSGAIQPGMWETTIRMNAGTTELWSSTVSRCVYSDETANPGTGFFKEGQLNHCTVGQSHFADGEFTVQAACPDKQSMMAEVPMSPEWLASKVTVKGTYASVRMEGKLSAEIEGAMEPTDFNGTLSARRTGDC